MVDGLLDRLGVPASAYTHGNHPVHTPIDGSAIASVILAASLLLLFTINTLQSRFGRRVVGH